MKVYLSYCAETNGADESDDIDSKMCTKAKIPEEKLETLRMYRRFKGFQFSVMIQQPEVTST